MPLIAQMNPDASTIAAGAPIEVDLSPIADGQVIKVFWRGKPIYVNHRTKKQIEEAENVDVAKLPDPQPDSARVKPGHEPVECLDRQSAPTWAASRLRTRGHTTATSVPATVQSTTPPVASGKDRRR